MLLAKAEFNSERCMIGEIPEGWLEIDRLASGGRETDRTMNPGPGKIADCDDEFEC
jgi:hypothetical protein